MSRTKECQLCVVKIYYCKIQLQILFNNKVDKLCNNSQLSPRNMVFICYDVLVAMICRSQDKILLVEPINGNICLIIIFYFILTVQNIRCLLMTSYGPECL